MKDKYEFLKDITGDNMDFRKTGIDTGNEEIKFLKDCYLGPHPRALHIDKEHSENPQKMFYGYEPGWYHWATSPTWIGLKGPYQTETLAIVMAEKYDRTQDFSNREKE